jgi:hypothetical protein
MNKQMYKVGIAFLVEFALLASISGQTTHPPRQLEPDPNNNMSANPGDSQRYKINVINACGTICGTNEIL